MDIYQRLGMYFFTLGALVSILAGALPLNAGMYEVVLVMLIFLGVFSAILNVSEEEELGFLVASASFLITIVGFKFLLGHHPLIIVLAQFFEVSTFFVGSMLGVVALKTVVEFGSQDITRDPLKHADEVDDHLDTLLFTRTERTWNFIVFLAVAMSFIVILLDVFFNLGQFALFFLVFDILITIVFLIDLIVLYKKEKSFGSFLSNCWLDIVATVPFYNILRVAKLARLIRLTRFIKLNKTLKFMSQKSGVRHYLHSPKPDDKLDPTLQPKRQPTRRTKK